MPAPDFITPLQLSRLIGLPSAPVIIDVRVPEDRNADTRFLPASVFREAIAAASWAKEFAGKSVVVVCQRGRKLSQGAAAWLRHEGIQAEVLEGGFESWVEGRWPTICPDHVPATVLCGSTLWVTRARPKVDRIACPWLIRRFIDAKATFLFVGASEVVAVAERFHATPFDIEDVHWTHRGENCTFDAMIEDFGLASYAPLARLAEIVRGADTARHDLTPQSAGLLAASLGYSRMYRDDLAQLDAAISLYDAFYLWCRDAVAESHNWPAKGAAKEPVA